MSVKSSLIAVLVLAGLSLLFHPHESIARGQADLTARVTSAEIKGLVFYADGETPAVRVPVRVWDVSEREFIYETETDEFGVYRLPKLEPGEYFVTFDWTRLRIVVLPSGGGAVQQPHDIIVVIPRDVGAVSVTHLSAILMATTLTEAARGYKDDRTTVVSP